MSGRLALTAAFLVLATSASAAQAADAAALGRKVFNELAEPACKLCHTLKAAEAEGTIGPSLDELKPDLEKALQAIRHGSGVMPPFREKLTPEQIEAVARFVAESAGK